jgi:hypothetical protein
MNASLVLPPVQISISVPFNYSRKAKIDFVLEALSATGREENISTTALISMCILGIVGLSVFVLESAIAVLDMLNR